MKIIFLIGVLSIVALIFLFISINGNKKTIVIKEGSKNIKQQEKSIPSVRLKNSKRFIVDSKSDFKPTDGEISSISYRNVRLSPTQFDADDDDVDENYRMKLYRLYQNQIFRDNGFESKIYGKVLEPYTDNNGNDIQFCLKGFREVKSVKNLQSSTVIEDPYGNYYEPMHLFSTFKIVTYGDTKCIEKDFQIYKYGNRFFDINGNIRIKIKDNFNYDNERPLLLWYTKNAIT